MPLSCRLDGEVIYGHSITDELWDSVRRNYRDMGLVMQCCSRLAIPKVSPLGTRFFAHKPDPSSRTCQAARESPEHLRLKWLIAKAAQDAGWTSITEATFERFRTDVLCSRSNVRVAFEVQLSRQRDIDFAKRQGQRAESNIRTLWLTKYLPHHNPSVDLPLFRIEWADNVEHATVAVDTKHLPVLSFVRGALSGKLSFFVPLSGARRVSIYFERVKCGRCYQVAAIPTYVSPDDHSLGDRDNPDGKAFSWIFDTTKQNTLSARLRSQMTDLVVCWRRAGDVIPQKYISRWSKPDGMVPVCARCRTWHFQNVKDKDRLASTRRSFDVDLTEEECLSLFGVSRWVWTAD